MRFARLSLCVLLVACASPYALRAKDPANVDVSQRNERLAPTTDNVDTPLSPARESNQRPFFRNEYLQEQRYNTPELVERKDFVSKDKRAPIDMKEARDKNIVDRKEYPRTPEVREREQSHLDGQQSRIQPRGDQIKQYDTVAKYQDRIADAKTAAAQRSPTIEKRASFEKLNRFVFKRNGPGGENGKPVVTPAAGGPPPASQDTYTRYQVDWKRFQPNSSAR